jgi:hypothetical protein
MISSPIRSWESIAARLKKLIPATGEKEANYMVGEYKMAFGRDWEIWKQPSTEEN